VDLNSKNRHHHLKYLFALPNLYGGDARVLSFEEGGLYFTVPV
jgi:hypothetical protein